MENLAFRIEREKRYGQHITIGNYTDGKRIYGGKAIYAASIASGDFISQKTRRENGRVIIKKENISPGELMILCHSGDYWAVYFYRVEDLIAYANAWYISKKQAEALQFKKEIAIG